jgi:hypothetical protein
MKQKVPFFALLALLVISAVALFNVADYLRMQRNIAYLMFQDRLEVFEGASHQVESTTRMLSQVQMAPEAWHHGPYLVISIAEQKLWYKQEGRVLYSAPVATGSGKALVRGGGSTAWRFDTPRGRMTVTEKVADPVWVPPDWHYVEQARIRGLGLAYLGGNNAISLSDGSTVRVSGFDVVRTYKSGQQQVLTATAKKEIVLDGMLLVPPLGTAQRRYKDVLGPYALELGDGYAIHGTDQPESIGRSVSHGCIRMLNDDVTKLFSLVKVGTPVYIY